MKNLIKITVTFLTFFLIFTSPTLSSDRILPLPKPIVGEEVKKAITKKKELLPKKKPRTQELNEKTVELTEEETVELTEEKEELTLIYPKKKPIIVQKKVDKVLPKSTILSKKDYKIAVSVFKNIEKKKWKTAISLSKKARDKTLYNLVNYLYLIKTSNQASFNDYSNFINSNSNYPRINRLRYLAEHKINLRTNSPISILKWFNNEDPLSSFGKIKLGEIYLSQGDFEKGSELIKEGWIKAKLSKSDLKYLRKKYKKIINVSDNIKRADWHAWEGKYWDLQRMLRYLPKDETNLYRARQLLMSRSYGVDNAIAKVPDKYKK